MDLSCLFVNFYGYKLQRSCCNGKYSCGMRAYKVEKSLQHSKTPGLKRLLVEDNINIDHAVEEILLIKSVSPEVYPQFGHALKTCLCQICGYRQLIQQLEIIRKTKYSSENHQHEAMIMQLWETLMPNEPLESRISKQWQEIGFQGDDPKTDFRGMGLLGLQNLVFFVTQFTDTARQVFSHSLHPQMGYSFAIVGINLSHMTYQLMQSGALKTHFYNLVLGKPRIEHFHQVYCYLFFEFDKFWFSEKPRDIMEFNRIKEKFQRKILTQLKNKSTTLHSGFVQESSV
ncbi:unnamed protein product [Owenia fusiformis]|uniref:ELMO domain-containing protein n=1 Tax=Owenia fusiformis TaxID=6347 RepID=A0A8S4N8M3_OWEFU|nr:unnamed protein product [Owenia fusiformis]